MKLKEFEAKQLLRAKEIPCNSGILITSPQDIPLLHSEKVLKVQTVANGRGKAGGIHFVNNQEEAKEKANRFLGKTFLNETITEILIDEKVDIKKEFYLGLLFDTSKRIPLLIFSEEGGVNIEQLKKESPEKILTQEINYLTGPSEEDINNTLNKIQLKEEIKGQLKEIISKLYSVFTEFDCKMVEINPLVVNTKNQLLAIDAVAVLDDDASYRRKIKFPKRVNSRKKKAREIAANKIDEEDPKGVAGKTYFDLDGDIGVLTSGGGASMTLMDTLVELGGKAANFTEYSGDPSREKVQKLTRIVLSKEKLSGLLVAGAIANFTNIKETLNGVADILIELKPDFPVVIRRAGPHDEEAKIMLAEVKQTHKLDIHYYDEKTPMTKAVEIMVELSNKYKEKKGVQRA